jgi:hypothetical protein
VVRDRRGFCFRSTIALFSQIPQAKQIGMASKPTRRDLLKTTATLAATSALAFDRATVDQNKNILLWSETRYRFIKRQSQADPNVWVSLSNQQPAIATATSR